MPFERTSNDQRKEPEGRRNRGRPALRLEDGMNNDVKALGGKKAVP
jgi:hypothetical protein